jgi:hypothetical protein
MALHYQHFVKGTVEDLDPLNLYSFNHSIITLHFFLKVSILDPNYLTQLK